MVYDIVKGTNSDIKETIDLVEKMAFELDYIKETEKKYFSRRKIQETLLDYIIDKDCGFFICKNSETKEQIGLLLCYIYQPFITNSLYKRAQDLLIQPAPHLSKTERSKIFLQLLEKYENWALKEKKVKNMFLGINVKNDITKSMMKKGFEKADYLLKKERGGINNG